MKPIAIILATLISIVALAGLFLAGTALGLRQNLDEHLRKMRLTRNSARLYKQAAEILTQLEQAGAYPHLHTTEDFLSTKTTQTITDWLNAYRKDNETP